MLKHISTILSKEALVDTTNMYSFINVINGFNLTGPAPQTVDGQGHTSIPVSFKIGTYWEWEPDVPEADKDVADIKRLVRFYAPSGELLLEQSPGAKATHATRTRASAIISVVQFPFVGFGTYRIGVRLLTEQSAVDDLEEFPTVPFELSNLDVPVQ